MSGIFPSRTSGKGWTNSQQFTTSGNFTVPNGVTRVAVRMIGGGATASSGRGSGGKLVEIEAMAVTPGAVMPVVVGAAGTGTTAGGASTFGGRSAAGGAAGGYDRSEEVRNEHAIGLSDYGMGSAQNTSMPAKPGVVEIYW